MVVFVWICIERQNSFTQLFQHIYSQTHYKHRFSSSQMEGSLCLSNNNDISTLLHKNLDEPFHHINILQGYLFYWIKELFVVSCGMEVHSKSNREAYFRHKLNLMPFNKRENFIDYLQRISCFLKGSSKLRALTCSSPSSDTFEPYMLIGQDWLVVSYTFTRIVCLLASCWSSFSTSDSMSKIPPRYLIGDGNIRKAAY